QGNDGIALLHDAGVELADLRLVQEELLGPQGILVEDVSVVVRADVHALDKGLAVADLDVAVLEVALARADGLDLRAKELDARLQLILYEVIVPRLAVLRALLDAFRHGKSPPLREVFRYQFS